MQGYDILDALEAIDPASLDYEGWLEVGQALHHEGYDSSVWRDWSRADGARFNERDFEVKWRSFGSSATPVTGGTIVKMARDAGWTPKPAGGWTVFDWGDSIGADRPIADGTIAAGNVLEPVEPDMPQWKQARDYLVELFEPDERVCYVCQSEYDESRGKWKPSGRGTYSRTCAEIVAALEKHRGLEDALGTYEHEAGIWTCFNPLDGEGRNNTNVTAFRYVLVESDETDPAVCKSVYEQLNLPVAAMVYSGAKSLHAIVHVDAADLREYNDRRDAVYAACEANGLKVDRSNKNPARLSRLPGAQRGDQEQFLVSLGCGAADFEEWQEWYEAANDDLPDCESLSEVMGDLPPLAPEVIGGVLRERHKMLISGPSKAGKSFALIQLCIALAEGSTWLGFGCRRSKVLYVNLELDAASCWHRFADAYTALGIEPENAGNIDVWNLRGMAQPMNRLLPKMVRRGREAGYEVIVIDPIYKVMTGDENSASDMAAFANAFDRLALEVGCSVIYCHHHSKGWQDGKRSIDRASGSGVFGRDPDAILDLIELAPDQKTIGEHIAEAELPEDARPTAWRMEGTLREFAGFEPVNLWFDYPIHRADRKLRGVKEMGSQSRGDSPMSENDAKNAAIAYAACVCMEDGVEVTRSNVFSRWPSWGPTLPKRESFDKWFRPSNQTGKGAKASWCAWYGSKKEGRKGNDPDILKMRPEMCPEIGAAFDDEW